MEPITVVVVGALVLFVLAGVGSFLAGGSLYEKIGEGGLSTEGPPPPAPPAGSPRELAEREQEIRQMLQARSERIVRKGGDPLDIDAEVTLLLGAAQTEARDKHDAALTAEVRQLVIARNERRQRRGEAPLDVEAEVQRTLTELDPDGCA